MQSFKSSLLKHVRLQPSFRNCSPFTLNKPVFLNFTTRFYTVVGNSSDHIIDRVVGLVRKFDKADASKVTETAHFQKDLCLDSLDRVELVMAFEQEFSVEIPDDEADKLTCCADVAHYILAAKNQTADDAS